MNVDLGTSRKIARTVKEAARRQCRRNNNGGHPNQNDVQVMIQLILNNIKNDLKDEGFQVF